MDPELAKKIEKEKKKEKKKKKDEKPKEDKRSTLLSFDDDLEDVEEFKVKKSKNPGV